MAKAYLIAIALGLVAHLFSHIPAHAFRNDKITRTVGLNQSVHIRNFIVYDERACRSVSPPSIDPRTPQLGEIKTKIIDRTLSNGPCGKDFKYQALSVTYKAGSVAGTDKFILYVYLNGFIPIPIEIIVGGRSSQSGKDISKKEKQEPKRVATVSSSPQRTPDPITKDQDIVGRYVENLGNIISIENGIVYFTGFWGKQKVERKPFAIKSYDGNEFEWSIYKCVGNSAEFRCSNTVREQVVLYRKLK